MIVFLLYNEFVDNLCKKSEYIKGDTPMSDNISIDTACKSFFNHNLHFSAFCNAILHGGKDIIHYDQLAPWQSEETTFIADDEDILDIKRQRDAIKKADINGCYAIIGLESQGYVDYTMALRVPIYDLLNYYNQYKNLLKGKKPKKLIPVTTIVLYVGEKKWTGAKSLKEMMQKIPKEMEKYVNDWKLIFIDIKEIDTKLIKDEETRNMIEAVKEIYSIEKGKKIESLKLTKEAAITAAAITKNEWLIEKAKEIKEREELDMCEALERYAKAYKDEGELVGKRQTVLQLLTKKLGQLSNAIIQKIEKCSLETIDILVTAIFDIESEDDILQLIH